MHFLKCVFDGEEINFSGVMFHKVANLSLAKFSGERIHFLNTTFNGEVHWRSTLSQRGRKLLLFLPPLKHAPFLWT